LPRYIPEAAKPVGTVAAGTKTSVRKIENCKKLASHLKLILNHQEVVPVKNHNIFGEASRHKKGQTADLFAVHVLSISESAIRSLPKMFAVKR
jgi:hypothetical protein